MSIKIPSVDNAIEPIEVGDQVFGKSYNEFLVHQVIVAYQENARAGTKQQKTRAEVSGGGVKPWRQKGTGRARAGSTRSPIWRAGGVTFAARPRGYGQKLNKKMYRAGMATILSELLRQGRLFVCGKIILKEPKTKSLIKALDVLSISGGVYVAEDIAENVVLAARNLKGIKVCIDMTINPVDLIKSKKVVLTVESVKRLEARLS